MSWKEKLNEEVIEDIEVIGDLSIDSDGYSKGVSKVNAMIDRLNESEKIDIEKRKLDIEEKKIKMEKLDRLIKNVLTGVTFIGGAAVTIWGTLYSDNFDVDNIRTNEAGKTHIRNWLGFMKK